MRNTTILFVVALTFGLTATTEAAVTVFSTEVDYNSATGAQIFFIDFDGNPEGGIYLSGNSFSPKVTFGSPEASDPTQVFWNEDTISDAGSTTAPNQIGPMDGVFTKPVYAFALVFSSAGVNETVYLYDESQIPIGMVVAPNASGFFGILSDTPIKSFFIDNGEFSDPAGYPDRFFVDDFRANKPPKNREFEGHGPGHWRRHTDSWMGYSPEQHFHEVFGVNGDGSVAVQNADGLTLLEALETLGGGYQALDRQAVAALLNAAHPDIDYPLSEYQVKLKITFVYEKGTQKQIEDLTYELEMYNGLGTQDD